LIIKIDLISNETEGLLMEIFNFNRSCVVLFFEGWTETMSLWIVIREISYKSLKIKPVI